MPALRSVLEALFTLLERLVTACLYPWCILAARFAAIPKVPILMYHQISPDLSASPPAGDAVSPARFEAQIQALQDAGYRVVPLSALVGGPGAGAPCDLRRAVVLTFDDGYRGQFAFAYPILRNRRLPATFFLVAGSVGTYDLLPHLAGGAPPRGAPRPFSPAWLPLSWDEVEDLERGGMSLGAHSLSHRSLGCLAEGEVAAEIRASRALLERRTGARVDLFAYPFGSRSYGDFDRAAEDALRRAGYRGACTTVVGRAGAGSDPFALPRIPMEDGDGPFRVRCKLAGAYDWVGPVKSLWQKLVPRAERVDAALPHQGGFPPGVWIDERPGH